MLALAQVTSLHVSSPAHLLSTVSAICLRPAGLWPAAVMCPDTEMCTAPLGPFWAQQVLVSIWKSKGFLITFKKCGGMWAVLVEGGQLDLHVFSNLGDSTTVCCVGVRLVSRNKAGNPLHLWAKGISTLGIHKDATAYHEPSNLWYWYIFILLHDCQLIKDIHQAAFVKAFLAKKA